MAAQNRSNEIRITRVYDAPVEAVWEAWTDPVQTGQWWGPRGFTLTTHSKDLRVGGSWRYTMHGPDGVDYVNRTEYLEVEPMRKLVYDHGGNDDRPAMFRVTVLFSEVGGRTKMEMSMALPTAEAAEETRKFIKKAGGDATWDRLAEYVAKEREGKEKFVISRSFGASLEKMFEVWTKAEHVEKWMPPTGFEMKFIRAEIRPGGETFYCMTGGGGMKMYGKAKYIEIVKPNRIVYTQEFSDENGGMARHPMAPTWPVVMLTTVELAEEGKEQTRVTVTWEVHGEATKEEMETFIKGRSGMTQGWGGSFEKLEGYLERL